MKRALLVIDMQKDFVYHNRPKTINNSFETINDIKDVLEYFRKRKEMVIHIIREYRKDGSDVEKFRLSHFKAKPFCVPGTEGAEEVDELKPIEGELVVVKNRFSAFMQTELDFILRRNQISELVITGTQYPNCIRTTAFDAVCLDYDVKVIPECVSAPTKEIAEANIVDMKNIGIQFINKKEFLAA